MVFPLNLGTAKILNAYCINDNLNNAASFYYALLSDGQSQLSQGNLTMIGQDYTDWQTNQYAYDWIATQINVTIVGDYVPPVPEPIAEIYVGEPSVLEVEPRSSVLGQITE